MGQKYREEKNKPVVYCLAITKGCMFQCKMCYLWKANRPDKDYTEVDILYWKRLIAALRNFIEGPLCINFVGGESLTSSVVLSLIKYASDLDCMSALTSNAYLIDENMSKEIADSGLSEIYLSLDSFNEETHDFLRGVKGSYKRLIQAIEYLHKYAKNVQLKISTVITAINLEESIDLASWVIQDHRIASVRFLAVMQPFDSHPDDFWYKKSEYSLLWPKEVEKVESVMDGLIELKEKNPRKIINPVSQFGVFKAYYRNPKDNFKQAGCDIYKRVLNMSSDGQISMCFNMDPIGNIKKEEFNMDKIWNSSLSGQVRDRIRNCGKNCHFKVNCYLDE